MRRTIYKGLQLTLRSPFGRLGVALVSLLKFGAFTVRPFQIAEKIVVQSTFGGNFEDKRYAIEVFNRRTEEVKRRVPKERLLVYEVKEGWGPLCDFLGVDVPNEPFPHVNEAADLQRLILAARVFSQHIAAVVNR